MSQPVIIKSNKYGLNLILDPDVPFPELLGHITKKFLESENFFKNARMAISFEGRELTREEEEKTLGIEKEEIFGFILKTIHELEKKKKKELVKS